MKRKCVWLILSAWVVLAASCAGSGQYGAITTVPNTGQVCAS
jgi:hypothetical protein